MSIGVKVFVGTTCVKHMSKLRIRKPSLESIFVACYTLPMITKLELENLANLARIKLTDEDKDSFVKEFDSVLTYIDQLKKADVPMDAEGRVGAVRNITRLDEVKSISLDDRERLLDEAPHRVGDFIAVKKIL